MNNTLTKTAHIDYHQVLDLTSPCTPKGCRKCPQKRTNVSICSYILQRISLYNERMSV